MSMLAPAAVTKPLQSAAISSNAINILLASGRNNAPAAFLEGCNVPALGCNKVVVHARSQLRQDIIYGIVCVGTVKWRHPARVVRLYRATVEGYPTPHMDMGVACARRKPVPHMCSSKKDILTTATLCAYVCQHRRLTW